MYDCVHWIKFGLSFLFFFSSCHSFIQASLKWCRMFGGRCLGIYWFRTKSCCWLVTSQLLRQVLITEANYFIFFSSLCKKCTCFLIFYSIISFYLYCLLLITNRFYCPIAKGIIPSAYFGSSSVGSIMLAAWHKMAVKVQGIYFFPSHIFAVWDFLTSFLMPQRKYY